MATTLEVCDMLGAQEVQVTEWRIPTQLKVCVHSLVNWYSRLAWHIFMFNNCRCDTGQYQAIFSGILALTFDQILPRKGDGECPCLSSSLCNHRLSVTNSVLECYAGAAHYRITPTRETGQVKTVLTSISSTLTGMRNVLKTKV